MDSWDLFEALNQGQKIIVVDRCSEIAYQHEHIQHAINIFIEVLHSRHWRI